MFNITKSSLAIALLIAASPAVADEALTNLKTCQSLARIRAVKDADTAEKKAETDLQAGFDALNTFEATCEANSKQYQNQSPEVSRQIGEQGQDAQAKTGTAKESALIAMENLNKAYPAVNMLGGRECAQEMHDDIGTLSGFYRDMVARSQAMLTCIYPPSQDGGPQSGGAGVR